MNLKVLFMIVCYYAILSIFFLYGNTYSNNTYTFNNPLNDSELSSSEIDTGGLFGTGVSFSRFFGFITIGVGLPDDTPSFFSVMFITWQTIITILSVGFIIASIWNG